MKTAKAIEQFVDCAVLSEPQELLIALFNESTFGFAICDKQLRFRAVNRALGAMNGIAPKAHLGKTIRDILGKAAAVFEPPFKHVFSSGRALSNVEVCAQLPKRREVGYWVENYFPIRDETGTVKQVGAMVLEITEQKKLQLSLNSITNKLIRNLISTTHDSDALLRQIMGGPPVQTLDSGTDRNPSRVRASSKEAPFSSLTAAPEVLQGFTEYAENANARVPVLTLREREVLKLLAEGHGNKETATILRISVKTVEAHRARIMLKLKLHSTTDLVYYAVSNKILNWDVPTTL